MAKAKPKAYPKSKADRQSKIIQAAIQLFIEQGVAFTRLSDVAKKAKVPAPLIHYYYQDVEDLHWDVVLQVLESLKDYNVKTAEKYKADPLRMLKEYLKGPLVWAKENPGYFSIWMYFYYLSSQSERFETLSTEIRERGRERISLMIFTGLEKGTFQNPHAWPVSRIAHYIQSQMTGQLVMFGCEKKVSPIETYLHDLEYSVFSVLGPKKTSRG